MVAIYICEFMHSWFHGFMASWLHGFMVSRLYAFMALCVHSFMRSCIHGFMCSWLYTFMVSCVHGFMHSWLHSFIDLCVHVFVVQSEGVMTFPFYLQSPFVLILWRKKTYRYATFLLHLSMHITIYSFQSKEKIRIMALCSFPILTFCHHSVISFTSTFYIQCKFYHFILGGLLIRIVLQRYITCSLHYKVEALWFISKISTSVCTEVVFYRETLYDRCMRPFEATKFYQAPSSWSYKREK